MKDFKRWLQEDKSEWGYIAWGWLDPKGKEIDGNSTIGATTHLKIVSRKGLYSYKDAFALGWVRWFTEKFTGNIRAAFEFTLSKKSIPNIIKYVLSNPNNLKHTNLYTVDVYDIDARRRLETPMQSNFRNASELVTFLQGMSKDLDRGDHRRGVR